MVKLYDSWGREIIPEKKPDDRVLAVASIRDRYSLYSSGGLTPQGLASIFKEANMGNIYRQAELFEEMEEKDTHLASILQTRKLAVAGIDFEITPFSQDKRDKEIADFVSDVIYNLPDLEDNLLDILDAVGKGFSAMELYWDLRNNKNVVRHMEWVQPKRFTWNTTLTPRLLTDQEPSMGIDLPAFKFLFHQHKTKSGYSTRQGVLRVVAWMYLFKNYDIKDWVAFAEVFGMPLRLGKYDSMATPEDKESLIQAVRSLGSDAAGVISKSTEIEFVEAVKNSGRDVYDLLANFCNTEMSKAVLGQTLTTQQGNSGSYSLGQVHNEVRGDLRKADCEMVSKSIRRDLIRPLVGYNFGWEAPLPWFKFHYEEPADLGAEATKIKTLVEAGVKTIPVNWVHEKFNIPKPKDGEETIRIGGNGLNGLNLVETSRRDVSTNLAMKSHMPHSEIRTCPVCLANKGRGGITPPVQGVAPDTVDEMTERLMKEANLDSLIEPIKKLVEESGSLEELRDRLLEVYDGMDPVELGNLMQRAFAAAELAGRFKAIQKA